MSINSFLRNFLVSDKMNSRNKIILSGALIALVMLVTTNVFFTSSVLADVGGTNETPSSAIAVYMIKKAALICDSGASAPEAQFPPQIGGCIDVMNADSGLDPGDVNQPDYGQAVTDFRFNEYLFGGEQLAELVVARDLSTAQFLESTAEMQIDGTTVVTCHEVPASIAEDLADGHATWYGHYVDHLLNHLPPQMGISDSEGYDEDFDVLYTCLLTVTNSMQGSPSSVAVKVSDQFGQWAITPVQKWYFNPAITIDISFDSGSSIQFPQAQQGQEVYSTNTMMISNTAAGGVDLAVYLVGHDLIDTSGIGACDTPNHQLTNVLDVNNIRYRCKVGTYMSETFTKLSHLKEANGCRDLDARQCLVEDGWEPNNDLLPDADSELTSILYNGHTAECWFKLSVPLPCVGSYSASNAVEVLVRAI